MFKFLDLFYISKNLNLKNFFMRWFVALEMIGFSIISLIYLIESIIIFVSFTKSDDIYFYVKICKMRDRQRNEICFAYNFQYLIAVLSKLRNDSIETIMITFQIYIHQVEIKFAWEFIAINVSCFISIAFPFFSLLQFLFFLMLLLFWASCYRHKAYILKHKNTLF